MGRPVTLFTGQWADMALEDLATKAASWGYDGLELACWGDHMEIDKACASESYCQEKLAMLENKGLNVWSISTHLVGQAVADRIDERHKAILPDYVWGDGDQDGVRKRAAEELIKTAQVAKSMGLSVVNGFTGSPIWHLLYAFPPVSEDMINAGYEEFAELWIPILDEFQKIGVKFGLEVHPTEIAFDIASAERTLQALDNHPAFGFNYDPSHLGYQGVDYVEFIYRFAKQIVHVHMKDAGWSDKLTEAGVFGGHVAFGDRRRYWDFRSLGRGSIDFEEIMRALNRINYTGPLSVEWEDSGMDREHGAEEACAFVQAVDFPASELAFDAAFDEANQ